MYSLKLNHNFQALETLGMMSQFEIWTEYLKEKSNLNNRVYRKSPEKKKQTLQCTGFSVDATIVLFSCLLL